MDVPRKYSWSNNSNKLVDQFHGNDQNNPNYHHFSFPWIDMSVIALCYLFVINKQINNTNPTTQGFYFLLLWFSWHSSFSLVHVHMLIISSIYQFRCKSLAHNGICICIGKIISCLYMIHNFSLVQSWQVPITGEMACLYQ